jgi:cytochrome P450
MDTATQFLFGCSAETQTAALVRAGKLPASAYRPSALDGFDERFIAAGRYVGHRIKLSNMYWLYDGFAFRQACRDLYRTVDAYVTEVRSKKTSSGNSLNAEDVPTNVLEEMESQGASRCDMVEQVMHLLVAGMDTSAAALGWMMAMLAARPEIYERLRKEILAVFGHEEETRSADCFTLETLKSCTYLQWCLNETLRLFPAGPINVREAVRDTVLPVGGGPDGMGPVAVAKGSRVQLGTYLT